MVSETMGPTTTTVSAVPVSMTMVSENTVAEVPGSTTKDFWSGVILQYLFQPAIQILYKNRIYWKLLKRAGCSLCCSSSSQHQPGWYLGKPACTKQYQASKIRCQMMLPAAGSFLRIQSKHARKAVELSKNYWRIWSCSCLDQRTSDWAKQLHQAEVKRPINPNLD